jgi:hypothetical protein
MASTGAASRAQSAAPRESRAESPVIPAHLLPNTRAFSSSASPFQSQSLERPFLASRDRSPSNNCHFSSGCRRFRRRPPFIVAAKRASRATLGGIGLASADYHGRWDRVIGSLPPAFERAAWVSPDDVLWASLPPLVAERASKKSLFSRPPPGIFAGFHGKRLALLWRGSRDGFRAGDCHGRCDGHAPTLTLIQDTEGNIFGGFTPVK